ncbi:hypothetical protein D3C85_608670 [compost metagenome]
MGTVNGAGCPLPQQLAHFQCLPGDVIDGCLSAGLLLPRLGEGIARIGEPGEPWQGEQPLGQHLEPVGGDAQQLEPLAVCQARRQGGQAVARQHQLLQGGALTQFVRQALDGVVGQDQPAQPGGQRLGGYHFDPVGLEAHHAERGAVPQHLGQRGEAILGAENDAQFAELGQLVRQRAQLVAGEIQHLQRFFEAQNLEGEHHQIFREFQVAGATKFARAQLFQGMHNHFSILSWPCLAALKQTIWYRRTWARRF